MSYLVLARKYRPKSFQDLVGQEHVVRALTHALESGRIHHAYLFTGTRGVGKTTLSRILAKCLNCEQGVTATPCGVCNACQAIDADHFVDYIELDAASNRGVNDMQQLLEQAIYAPTAARYKVYMIDEVHMLSNHAFNAMLKALEEPPEYVKFILATTDPQKIPVTVLSRCLQFNLKQMPQEMIVSHLSHILDSEGITYEKVALHQLARGAQGSMRDALSLTDQAIAYTAGNITGDAIQDMLGTLDQTYLVRLLKGLIAKDGAALLAIADEMASRGLSYSVALQDFATIFNRIAMIQCVPSYSPDDLPQFEAFREIAQHLSPEEVQLYYQIAIRGLQEIELAPDEYAGFTMTLLRMLAFAPLTEIDKTPEVSSKQLAALPTKRGDAETFKKQSFNEIEPVSALSQRTKGFISSQSVLGDENLANTVRTSDSKEWDENWPALTRNIPIKGLARQLAQQTELVNFSVKNGERFFLLRAPTSAICTPSAVSKLREWLSQHFGGPVKIQTEVGKTEHTASRDVHEERAARQNQAEIAMENDPYIQKLASEFGAQIVKGSIKPN